MSEDKKYVEEMEPESTDTEVNETMSLELDKTIQTYEKKLSDYDEKLQRALADSQNLERRTQVEISQRIYAKTNGLLLGFINIYEPHSDTKNYLKHKYKNKSKFKILDKINNQKFDLIILADVLEHIKKDKKVIEKLSNNLKHNGQILITVPAYQFLFSMKDITLGHYRRYNKTQILKLFQKFKIIKLTYFNFFLFTPISFLILFFKLFKIDFINKVESAPNQYINKTLFHIFSIERKIIKILDLPFGLSLLGLFKKK